MLTAAVLARNSEITLASCLDSLKFCDQVLVIDNNSTDKTVVIAKKYSAIVKNCPILDDFAALRNCAIDHASGEWILFIDADEVVPPKLSQEIKKVLSDPKYVAYQIPRLDHMWGQDLRHGDTGGIKLTRLAKKSVGTWVGRVHETWKINEKIGELNNSILHYPHPTLYQFLTSINYYSDIRASELYSQGQRSNIFQIMFYPLGKFIKLWIIKLGFLDGTAGFIHAMTMAFYSFLVRGKLYMQA